MNEPIHQKSKLYPVEFNHHPDRDSLDNNLKFGIMVELTEKEIGGEKVKQISYIDTDFAPDVDVLYDALKISKVDDAFSLMGVLSGWYYHFVIEYALDLLGKNIPEGRLQQSKILLDGEKINYKKQWLQVLFPKLTDNNFITMEPGRSIYCKKLTPAGRFMGLPKHLGYMRKMCLHANKTIIDNLSLTDIHQDTMLLIKRSGSRTLYNWDTLHNICVEYCDEHNLQLDVFDDSSDLGSVESQLKRFNKAKIVIGSHGAGFVNVLACTNTSSLIELKNFNSPMMYKRLAKILNINYQCIDVVNHKVSDIGVIQEKLNNITGPV